jgi:hypothetical protein
VNYTSGILVLALVLSASSPASSQTIPKDTCSVLSQADLDAVLGKGAKAEPIGDEQCEYEVAHHPILKDGFSLAVRRSNGARELKDWTELAMVKPVKPVAGVGDEAFISDNNRTVAFRKGNAAVLVNATGAFKQTPMPFQQALVEAAKRIAANIK